jgi:ring-1,2-phenylacetyl-CoA epoxidase subunit PaaC
MTIENPSDAHSQYILSLADNVLILGQRLGEWCGHGPVLEQDIAMTNIALDLIGQARMYYQYVAELHASEGRQEDDYPYFRDSWDFLNNQLVEQPNGHWGQTIMRQFLFDSWHFYFLQQLQQSADQRLSEIATKSIKEVAYHLRFSSEWVIRLGDGTSTSHQKMQEALDELWRFGEDVWDQPEYETAMITENIAPHPEKYRQEVHNKRVEISERANLSIPHPTVMMKGGKRGIHTEHLGYILTELQHVQRSYPGLTW